MNQETSILFKIKCRCCGTTVEEMADASAKLEDSLNSLCKKAMESQWHSAVIIEGGNILVDGDFWLCPKCSKKGGYLSRCYKRFPRSTEGTLLSLGVFIIVVAMVMVARQELRSHDMPHEIFPSSDSTFKTWDEFIEEKILSLSRDQRKALRWVAINWRVTGDEWRTRFPHVDACELHGIVPVMERDLSMDTWTIKRDSRKVILKVTKEKVL